MVIHVPYKNRLLNCIEPFHKTISCENVAGPSAGPSSNLNPQSLLQNQFISLAQPYQNCTQHIQIGTMNIYHGKYEEASPSTRKRRRIIESDNSEKNLFDEISKDSLSPLPVNGKTIIFLNVNCLFANHCYQSF